MRQKKNKATFWKHVGVLTVAILLLACLGFGMTWYQEIAPHFRTAPEQWEIDKGESSYAPELYFTLFLAAGSELAYEVAHPAIHNQITEWLVTHEPVCSEESMPSDWVLGGDAVFLVCRCRFAVADIRTVVDESYSPYPVVTNFGPAQLECPD